MSGDSDSENDEQIKQFLEAADSTLLNNSMFQTKEGNPDQLRIANQNKTDTAEDKIKDIQKSQRYLQEDEDNTLTDFNLPATMQTFMAKKLSEILKQHYEFYNVTNKDGSKKGESKHKNRVKLLKGDEFCVNRYEDFEYETKGPEKKPEIKRRVVDEQNINQKDKIKMVAVDGNFILSGCDMKKWAKKKDRKDKIFHYRLASTGVAHALEDINEFTEVRRKNKWNESKIKIKRKK